MFAGIIVAILQASSMVLPSSVRINNARIVEVVSVMLARSPTFERMMRRIAESDVIVYIQAERCATQPARACLTLMGDTGGHRYLRISISVDKPLYAIGAQVAHELQHVVEIADAPDVRDPRALSVLYRRIGYAVTQKNVFETTGATTVERTVLREYTTMLAKQTRDRP